MYICIYICIYMYILYILYIYTCIYIYIYTHTYIHICMDVLYTFLHIYTYIYTYTYKCISPSYPPKGGSALKYHTLAICRTNCVAAHFSFDIATNQNSVASSRFMNTKIGVFVSRMMISNESRCQLEVFLSTPLTHTISTSNNIVPKKKIQSLSTLTVVCSLPQTLITVPRLQSRRLWCNRGVTGGHYTHTHTHTCAQTYTHTHTHTHAHTHTHIHPLHYIFQF